MKLLFISALSFTLLVSACASAKMQPQPETIIYLVRHAEKQSDGTKDSSLSTQGIQRAAYLAKLLKNVSFDAIYSTPYKRTMQTAAPSLKQSGLENITSYLGDDLEEVAEQMLATKGTYLVVGHSNTTPQLVSLLTGQEIAPLKESDFDRLYKVSIDINGGAELEMLPYSPIFQNLNVME